MHRVAAGEGCESSQSAVCDRALRIHCIVEVEAAVVVAPAVSSVVVAAAVSAVVAGVEVELTDETDGALAMTEPIAVTA